MENSYVGSVAILTQVVEEFPDVGSQIQVLHSVYKSGIKLK